MKALIGLRPALHTAVIVLALVAIPAAGSAATLGGVQALLPGFAAASGSDVVLIQKRTRKKARRGATKRRVKTRRTRKAARPGATKKSFSREEVLNSGGY
ncbi:MAG TPA: hypothetical protein VMX97_11595 [Hyphomicrobiaceae bacterium]|nr:hypothetical protein [Hyphomicrobiaceae bacterium]